MSNCNSDFDSIGRLSAMDEMMMSTPYTSPCKSKKKPAPSFPEHGERRPRSGSTPEKQEPALKEIKMPKPFIL